MSNVFQYTSVTYAQFPEDLVDNKLAKLKYGTVKLYLLILRRAQQYSSPLVRISTEDAIKAIDLKENSHSIARRELKAHNLASSGKENNQGLWWYQLLHPTTGQPIPHRNAKIDLNKLPPDQVRRYFMHHLAAFDVEDKDDSSLRSQCPFHYTIKSRQKPFTVRLIDGGVWNCFRCNKHGRLLAFEKAIDRKDVVTSAMAIERIRRIIDPTPTLDQRLGDVGELAGVAAI